MFKILLKAFVNSPFYPHWLEYFKMNSANKFLLNELYGNILEVGAGDGSRKEKFLKLNKNIKSYTATDFSSWNNEFDKINKKVNIFGELTEIFFGYKKRIKLDAVCDAMNLPFENSEFDCHVSFEVLEHISNPYRYFEEASRVIKSNGKIFFSSPFLYRMHGLEPDHKMDFFRYLNGFFYNIAEKNNLKVVKIYSNTGIGTTVASLINQYLIRRALESFIILRPIFFIISPFVFLFTNIIGFLIDLFPDKRFATRFHVILQK